MKIKAVLCLLFFAGSAQAADVTISWINATTNTDSSDIVLSGPGSLVSTTVKWGACNPDDTPAAPLLEQTVPTTVPGGNESTIITIFTPLRWCFIGVHTNSLGQTSADSNPTFRLIVVVPAPPQGLAVVEPALTVYDIVKQADRYVLLAVGTVPGGTPCDSSQSVSGRYVVPNDIVTWFGNVRPPVVVADCS